MNKRLTAQMVFDHLVPDILSKQPDVARKVDAVIAVELIGEHGGYWTIDLTDKPGIERGKTKDPKCTLITQVNDFEDLLANPSMLAVLDAFKKKRIEVTGHLPTMLRIEGLLSGK